MDRHLGSINAARLLGALKYGAYPTQKCLSAQDTSPALSYLLSLGILGGRYSSEPQQTVVEH